jgi:hypothetical protein
MVRPAEHTGRKFMAIRISSLQHTVAVFAAILGTVAVLAFSNPILPIA